MENIKLRFNKNGKFRVLMVSDFHLGINPKLQEDYNYKVIRGLDALIETSKPDFVMIGGDQILTYGTPENIKAKFEEIIEPIISRKIPWGAVFGNHDRECGIDIAEEMKIYQSIPYCLAEAGPEEISGVGNYVIPVLASDSDEIKYNLWAMDSQHQVKDYIEKFGLAEDTKIVLPNPLNDGSGDGTPLFDQVMWYYQKSVESEKENKKKIPGIMFMHIPIPEYLLISRNPEQCNAMGSKRESSCATEINSGLFMAALQRGDIKGFFFGHDHLVDMQGEYCGITLACDGALGYNMSAHDDLRGGRVIELSEDGGMETYNIKLIDILGRIAMRDEDYFEGGCRYHIRVL